MPQRCHPMIRNDPERQNASRYHGHPVTGWSEVLIWQNFQPTSTEISGTKTAGRQRGRPLIHTSKILQKIEVRRDLGNRAHVKRPLAGSCRVIELTTILYLCWDFIFTGRLVIVLHKTWTIRQFHVVDVQRQQRNVQKKRAELLFCYLKVMLHGTMRNDDF